MSARRRRLAPEVVQASATDCGPASLQCIFEGFRVAADYERLREACCTGRDGTSIDALEDVAVAAGFDAEQILLPIDRALDALPSLLPSVLVMRQPAGALHFVVVWSRHHGLFQVMDPSKGRRWVRSESLLAEAYVHSVRVPESEWRSWTSTDQFLDPIRRRLAKFDGTDGGAAMLAAAVRDPSWKALARLDAASRLVSELLTERAVRSRAEAGRVLRALLASAERTEGPASLIPTSRWAAREAKSGSGANELAVRGVLVLTVRGRRRVDGPGHSAAQPTRTGREEASVAQPSRSDPLIDTLLSSGRTSAARQIWDLLRADAGRMAGAMIVATVVGAGATLAEAVALRAMLDASPLLAVMEERIAAVAVLSALLIGTSLLSVTLHALGLWLGRRLEARVWMTVFHALPRVPDRYLSTRPVSDLAERSHSVHRLRLLPTICLRIAWHGAQLLAICVAICWIDPSTWPWALGLAATCAALPLLAQPWITERDLRLRAVVGGLALGYLDALQGRDAAAGVGAERAIRREHDQLVGGWSHAARRLLHAGLLVDLAVSVAGFTLAAGLFVRYVDRAPGSGAAILLLFWALSVPLGARQLARAARTLADLRNVALRVLEPTRGLPKDGARGSARTPPLPSEGRERRPVAIRLSGVGVEVAGRAVLADLALDVGAGEHVAIVGPSGAGKSSLFGLLLGWHSPARGTLLLDGVPLGRHELETLRGETVWLDPSIELWDRTLHQNVHYGADSGADAREALELAELERAIRDLPGGLSEPIGHGGSRLSGGEGQCLRFARSQMRLHPRLVLLDEPFRGLEHAQRRRLLDAARDRWRDSTLLCITHDVEEAARFPRVVVVEAGRIVEDASPSELLSRRGSRFALAIHDEQDARELLLAEGLRHVRLVAGRPGETPCGVGG